MVSTGTSLLSLDIGERRIGVAIASLIGRLPSPLKTLERSDNSMLEIAKLLQDEDAAGIVLGLPRGLEGQETGQTRSAQAFGAELAQQITVPMYWQDEAVTSIKAEAELKRRGKPYVKGDIDALAATYILEDFLHDHPEVA